MSSPAAGWDPAGPRRGSVVLVPGRGERPAAYDRLGRRLAADDYAVTVAPEGATPAAVAGLVVPGAVLVGADTGALVALAAAREPAAADLAGLVLAGLPTGPAVAPADLSLEAELDLRTSCQEHRVLLAGEAALVPGRLADPVPDDLLPPLLPDGLPVLLLHGAADPVAPAEPVRALAARSASARLLLVSGGRHDVLNDAAYRSVAGALVVFLEGVHGADLQNAPPTVAARAASRVGPAGFTPGHATPGMTREQAVDAGPVWAGLVHTEGGRTSGWHHHGEHTSILYIVSGTLRLESGPGGGVVEDGGPGDFLLVPPYVVHREGNPHDTPSTAVVVRSGSGRPGEPVVVNVDGPA